MNILVSFVAGILFAVGLSISGMTNPKVVIGFLDIFGDWDYSLVFVMLGAVGFNLLSFRLIGKTKPVLAPEYYSPSKKSIDKKLIIGSAMFGIGWGIIGVCPGPGIVNLSSLEPGAIYFILSMALGMLLFKLIDKKTNKLSSSDS